MEPDSEFQAQSTAPEINGRPATTEAATGSGTEEDAAAMQPATVGESEAAAPSEDQDVEQLSGKDDAGTPVADDDLPAAAPIISDGDDGTSIQVPPADQPSPAQYNYPAHPLAALFPSIPKRDFADLVHSIEKNGLLEPIVLYEDQIVDGRHRQAACKEAGVTPRYVKWEDVKQGFTSLAQWVLSMNIRRRHMSKNQIAAAFLKLNGWEARQLAGERQAQGRRQGGKAAGRGRSKANSSMTDSSSSYSAGGPTARPSAPEPENATPSPQKSGSRRANLAKELNLSEHEAQQLLDIEKGAPDLLEEVLQGRMTVLEAAKRARENLDRKTRRSARKKPVASATEAAPSPRDECNTNLETLITRAVLAVEEVLALVPDEKKEYFKSQVSDTISKLAA
jgi:hypothetical protein